MISIFTLNLWRYYDFDSRKQKIIKFLKKNDPDIIFLQEVQINQGFSPFSQVELIKKVLPNYKYSIHSTIYLKYFERGKRLKVPVQHGMAILSKYPILNSFEYFLAQANNELEPRSILCFDVVIKTKIYYFANIHFTNKEQTAKNELIEFLKFIHSRGEKRIMAGDFNLFDLPKYSDIYLGYNLSHNFKNYLSYPNDNGCLDYVLIPDNFEFKDMELSEPGLSDHKGVFVKIQ
jgi:endonuclease/exonuclease/phosphatase family metal-dependent hydrolase